MTSKEGYRIVEQLGSGLAGPVFLAESEAGRVAIRLFQPHGPSGTEEVAYERLRFIQSARRAAVLRQARIVSVLEVLDEGEDSFAAVEYVPHKTLKEAMDREPFSPEQTTQLIRRVALALHYANQNGVVHGDLKPSNIFLLPPDEVKISDFAVSPRAWSAPRVIPAEWGHAYLAPEYYSDRDRLGPQSDQYALAATAYHLYTQRLPYRGLGERGAERTALQAASSLRPGIPAATDAVLAKALASNPSNRFGSCLEFSDALVASFNPGIPVTAVEERRKTPLWLWLAVGAALLVALAVFVLWPKRGAEATKPRMAAVEAPPNFPRVPDRPAKAAATVDAPPAERKAEPPTKRAADRIKPEQSENPTPAPREQSRPPAETVRLKPSVPALATVPESAGTATAANSPVRIELFSRTHSIEPGITFSAKDFEIGEMAQGDLQAVVRGHAAKGKMTLDWYVDNIRMDSKEIVPNKVVAYGNDPTAGDYRVVLRQNLKEVSRFTFRLTK